MRNKRRNPPLLTSPPKIECPAFLTGYFKQWKEDPSAFLLNTDVTVDLDTSFAGVYLALKAQSKQNRIGVIRWRFFLLLFHSWKMDFGTRLSQNTNADFVRVITQSGLVNDDATLVAANVKKWGNGGRRYDQLRKSLNERANKDKDKRGVVLLLPEMISCNQ